MAQSAALLTYPRLSIASHFATSKPIKSRRLYSWKRFVLKASFTSFDSSVSPSTLSQSSSNPPITSNSWLWKYNDNSVKIYYEEHGDPSIPSKKILMLPTISDVSTVEEWRAVAEDILHQPGASDWNATIVDWPGLGFSDCPKLDYDADVMEKFLVDFINSADSPMSKTAGDDLVIFGGGHAATLLVRASKKGLFKPRAIAAVAPTWAGPLPIVFGRDSSMESRYGFLRGTLRSPAVGWMVYNALVSNASGIEKQYKSHVYEDANNVTPDIIESRYKLTRRSGARYAPAAFLTGLLDPVTSREEFVALFSGVDGVVPVLVVSSKGSPSRSKAEMQALKGAKGVSNYVEVAGALLPHEEYPSDVAKVLYSFLKDNCK